MPSIALALILLTLVDLVVEICVHSKAIKAQSEMFFTESALFKRKRRFTVNQEVGITSGIALLFTLILACGLIFGAGKIDCVEGRYYDYHVCHKCSDSLGELCATCERPDVC